MCVWILGEGAGGQAGGVLVSCPYAQNRCAVLICSLFTWLLVFNNPSHTIGFLMAKLCRLWQTHFNVKIIVLIPGLGHKNGMPILLGYMLCF